MQEAVQTYPTVEEFLTDMDKVFVEAESSQAPFVMTASLIHPKDGSEIQLQCVIEYSLDGVVGGTCETKLGAEGIKNIMDYFINSPSNRTALPVFSRMSIESLIDNIFEDYISAEDMQATAQNIHPEAEYLGIISQLKIELDTKGYMAYSFSYGIQIHADTAAQEFQEAKRLGLPMDTFKASNPNRYLGLGEMTVTAATHL